MKKLAFLLGMVVMTTSLAIAQSHYTKNTTTGMYDYAGDSVASISVDFTTWAADSLVDDSVGSNYTSGPHTLAFVERGGLGFQRCVIYPNRWLASGVPNKTALFNNSLPRDADSLDNVAIYFPPVQGGVKQITAAAKMGGKGLLVLGYSESAAAWQKLGVWAIGSSYNNYTYDVNSTDIRRIALYGQTGNTAYMNITNIDVTSMAATEEEQPVDTALYVLNPFTGIYSYNGAPVNQLAVDFTSWSNTDLPTPLADDMPLAEHMGLGFVKWKIASRSCGEKGTVNALFNNDNGDFTNKDASNKNNATSNKPRIYLPTTTASVSNLRMYAGNGDVSLKVYYMDNDHTAWTYAGNITLNKAYGEQTLAINSNGPTTIYIEYGSTAYIAITDLVLEIAGAPTPVTEVQLDVTKTQLQVGNTLTLHATVLPDDATDKTVTWESDAPGIASVDSNGVVTAIAPGVAHITAKAGVKSAGCEIDVKESVVYATGIQWNVANKAFEMTMGDSLVVTYNILPENATEREVILSSDNANCVRVTQEGMLYADGGGVAHIVATLLDFNDTLTVTVDDPNMPKGELDWEQDGSYWGDSVNYVYEDFNTWPMSALRSEFTSEDIQQYKKLGFIRWKMEKRADLIGVQQWSTTDKYICLFTNNPTIDGHPTTDSAHHAHIYLPTLKRGAGAIRIRGYASTSNGGSVGLQLGWYNEEWSEDQAGYTFIKTINLPGDGSNIVESSLDIEEPVTLTISYQQSPYPSIYSIQVSPYGFPLSDDPDTDFADLEEGLEDVYGGVKAVKMMVNGQLIIVKNGQTYTVLGTPINLK